MVKNGAKSKKKGLFAFIALCLIAGVIGYLYLKTDVFLKLFKIKYDITFVVEGKEYVQQVEYDTIPEFEGELSKTPTDTIEYVFDKWEPAIEKVTGPAKYTAVFKEQQRLYNISVKSNYEGAGIYSGFGKIYPYMSDGIISVEVNNGYNFVGWYVNDVFQTDAPSITLEDIDKDVEFEARFETIKRTIAYNNTKAVENRNLTTYDVTNGTIVLENLSANGYKFEGWFTGINGSGEKVETINSSLLKNYNLYAHWSIIEYTISYNLKGAEEISNPTKYTIESADITVLNPTKSGAVFIGWTGTGLNEVTNPLIIKSGSYGNKSFVARWSGDERVVTLNIDGSDVQDIDTYLGEVITKDKINTEFDSAKFGMAGYSVLNWYTNLDCTNVYDFSSSIEDDLILYGKYEYLLDEIYFYPYIDKFEQATTSLELSVASREELVAWIDYVRFYDIKEKVYITMTHVGSDESTVSAELNAAYNELLNKTSFQTTSVFLPDFKSVMGNVKACIYVTTSNIGLEASLTADPEKDDIFVQQDHAIRMQDDGTRAPDYDNFNINKVKNTISVSTSEQLVHVLQSGYKPNPVAGSSAESMYKKAKQVLREICDDSMTDFEKLRAIYEWIVLNVEYDNAALKLAESTTSVAYLRKYDAWYLEGVFNNGVAVCEGFAKAFIVLSKIENIPAVMVTGNQHAWNRVLCDGKWYGVDATHGSQTVNFGNGVKYEILTYNQFLFTDEFKESLYFSTTDYSDFSAKTNINAYDLMEYEYIGQTFDLCIDSVLELVLVLQYADAYVDILNSTYLTFEVSAASEFNFRNALSDASSQIGVSTILTFEDVDAFGNKVYSIRMLA